MNAKLTNVLLSVVVFLLGVVGYFGKMQIDELQKTRDLMIDVRLELVDTKGKTQANLSAITDHEARLRELEKLAKVDSKPVKATATLPFPIGTGNYPSIPRQTASLYLAKHEEYLTCSNNNKSGKEN